MRTPRPPYRVPSLEEIRALPKNGLKVVSTFSGCGGSCLGFEMAGYEIVYASEFVEIARATYEANHLGVYVDPRDIRQIRGEEILSRAKLALGEVDVLEGSPPCASFSTAGKRSKGWGQMRPYSETSQRVDDLFFEFARLVDEIRPKTFVAENVSGLIKGVAVGYFKEIHRALAAKGYRVEARLLDAAWLGVPQVRKRIIFVGVREDLELAPAFPKPLSYRYTLRDALPYLAQVTGRTDPQFRRVESELDQPMNTIIASDDAHTRYRVREAVVIGAKRTRSLGEPAPTIQTHGNRLTRSAFTLAEPRETPEPESSMVGLSTGDEWKKLQPGGQSEKYFQLVRPRVDEPSPTVTALGGNAGLASVTHPYEERKFTIAELRRVCGFPDDFVLLGTYAQQWERLGRAVPPPMMRAVAETLRDEILLSREESRGAL